MDVKEALAGATRPCPACGGSGRHVGLETSVWNCQGCQPTPGTGRVYLFSDATGVRVPCGCPKSIDHRRNWISPCGKLLDGQIVSCQGRGWTAATDGWTWIDAAMSLEILFGFPGGAEKGFFATVLQEVEAMEGVELGP